jgi:hypothetical protein
MEKPTVESVRRFLKDFGSDGWSILEPDALVKGYGFPEEWAAKLVYNHKSQGGKFDITSNKTGKVVKGMKGVHTLTVLDRLASEFDARAPQKFGRGSQASAYTEAILKVIG